MKKIIAMVTGFLLLAGGAMAQDSTYYRHHPQKLQQALQQENINSLKAKEKTISNTRTPEVQSPLSQPYRDTRLGGSSPLYNTYVKNKYGAGAVTTNPNKWGSGLTPSSENAQTYESDLLLSPKSRSAIYRPYIKTSPGYRDTRLGSSSPLYNTYAKNKYGAGAITTNPNKGGSVVPPVASSTLQPVQNPIDSVRHQ